MFCDRSGSGYLHMAHIDHSATDVIQLTESQSAWQLARSESNDFVGVAEKRITESGKDKRSGKRLSGQRRSYVPQPATMCAPGSN